MPLYRHPAKRRSIANPPPGGRRADRATPSKRGDEALPGRTGRQDLEGGQPRPGPEVKLQPTDLVAASKDGTLRDGFGKTWINLLDEIAKKPADCSGYYLAIIDSECPFWSRASSTCSQPPSSCLQRHPEGAL